MDNIAERNRAGLRLAKSGAVPVGSFWFMQEPGEEPWIVDDRIFIPTGETDTQYILRHEDYVACWRTIEARKAASPLLHYLEGYGPDDWPRGRVVFNTVTKEFKVYLDKQLRTPQFEKQVLTRFHLTTDETSFAIDPSYAARFILGPDGPQTHEPYPPCLGFQCALIVELRI
jgi:hypothetical protein